MTFPASKIAPPAKRPPSVRRLRVYAGDPSFNWQLDTAVINQMTLQVPWEPLGPGPVGEYLEVVDVDPASECCYAPVDLNDPNLLAMDGLDPAEGDPQFHQQMVYAVAMTTIRNFERALGRRVFWSETSERHGFAYVPRLRIYPHALREANAYYSPQKKALLFGYFPASTTDPGNNLPGGTVFACLSHDVIAHEVTHALLDGIHRRFIEPSNGDALALHEAFADVIALFQHFSFPEVLRDQIAKTRGDLAAQNRLAELAHQLGQAIGSYGALRDALGTIDPQTRKWVPTEPNPADIQRAHEPHERGSLLVAAVFDAFLSIYKSRVADLLRIATGGSGVLPEGAIHPDLVERMAREAAEVSSHILDMCIRALDYCPPVDIDFGDYLRALVTADRDLVPEDDRRYRISMIEAFRRRGIYPKGVRSLSAESLCWTGPALDELPAFKQLLPGVKYFREVRPDWTLTSQREEAWREAKASAERVHDWLADSGRSLGRYLGLALEADAPKSIARNAKTRLPLFEVHSVRPARRFGPDGESRTDLVIEITQKRHGYLDREIQEKVDKGKLEPPPHDFWFRGGCTILVDLESRDVRYCIGKGITSANRLEQQRKFLSGDLDGSLAATYFGDARGREDREPFALLHRSL